jgi:hypothetical protein
MPGHDLHWDREILIVDGTAPNVMVTPTMANENAASSAELVANVLAVSPHAAAGVRSRVEV